MLIRTAILLHSVVLDPEDAKVYADYSCAINNHGHVRLHLPSGLKSYLHRELVNCPAGYVVDHINRNPRDNRKENLRITTQSKNMFNTSIYSHNTSGVKGVSLFKRTGRWQAYIKVKGTNVHLGFFSTIEEAEHARRQAENIYQTC